MAAQPQKTVDFQTVHANSWPPHMAAPGTCPFTINGTLLETYPLTIKPAPLPSTGGFKAADEAPVEYTALRVQVKSYMRCPAEGEVSEPTPIDEKGFKTNVDGFIEYMLGEPSAHTEGGIAHVWTQPGEWVFWATPAVMAKSKAAVGGPITFTTACSTNCVDYWGEFNLGGAAAAAAKPAINLFAGLPASIAKKVAAKKPKDDDDW